MSSPQYHSPVNALPPVVMALALAIVVVEAGFSLGSNGFVGGPGAVGWRAEAIQAYGFSNRALAWMIGNGAFRGDYAVRFLTYPFIHGSFTHALFAAVMVLALGKFVAERMAQWAVLVLFAGSAAIGALIFGLVLPDGPGLIGAFPGVYGLIGGFTYLMWVRLGEMGEKQITAFTLIALLLMVQLVFGLIGGGGGDWLADVAGFAAGFAMSFMLAPGGWRKLRDKLRHE